MPFRTDILAKGAGALWKETVDKVHRNPSLLKQVTSLSGDHKGVDVDLVLVDGKPLIDTFQILDIVVRNACGCPTPTKKQSQIHLGFHHHSDGAINSGFWHHASHINHSCVSNTERVFVGDLIVFRAYKHVAKGEELTVAYGFDPDFEERQRVQQERWDFRCQCLLFVVQGGDEPANRWERKQLEQEASAFMMRNRLSDTGPPPSDVSVAAAEKLAQRIKATYAAERYQKVPRHAALGTQNWLVQAHHDRRNARGCLAAMAEMFKLLACEDVVISEKAVNIRPSEGSMLTANAVDALGGASRTMLMRCNERAASGLQALARERYLVLNGVMNGWERMAG